MRLNIKLIGSLILFSILPAQAYSATLAQLVSKFGKDLKGQSARIAVMDFSSKGIDREAAAFVVRERFTTLLAQNKNITLIERALLEKVLNEQKVQMSGAISNGSVITIGELIGADLVISGAISELMGDDVEVNARIIRVNTGEILSAGTAILKKDWAYVMPLAEKENDSASSDSAKDYYKKGAQYYKEQKYSMAIELYGKAIALKADYFEAIYNRAITRMIKADYDDAIADFTLVLNLNPNYTQAYFNRGLAYSRKGEYNLAISDYDKAIELNSSNPVYFFQRGYANIVQDNKKAIEDYTRAINLDPKYINAYVERSFLYGLNGKYSKAISDANVAIKLNPKNPIPYRIRGDWNLKLANYDNALKDYNKAIILEPDFGPTYAARGEVYQLKKLNAKAIEDFNKADRLRASEK